MSAIDQMDIRIMKFGDSCLMCKKDLNYELGCEIWYKIYCMACSKPLRKLVKKHTTQEFKKENKKWWETDYYNNNWDKQQSKRKYQENKKRIIVELPTYRKMLYYTQAAPGEISGLGRVKVAGDDIHITNAIIFKQKCSSGGTHLDAQTMSQFIVSLIQMGFSPEDWRLWWHSHNDFGVFWSSIDDTTTKELSKDSLLYSICINKNGEMVGREDEDGVEIAIPTIALPEEDSKMKAQCEKEVKELVTEEKFNYYNHSKRKKHKRYKRYNYENEYENAFGKNKGRRYNNHGRKSVYTPVRTYEYDRVTKRMVVVDRSGGNR